MTSTSSPRPGYISPKADIAPNAVIAPTAYVGEGAFIDQGCDIRKGAVIAAGVRIGAYSTVDAHCHIGEGTVIGGQSQILGLSKIGERSLIEAKTTLYQVSVGNDVRIPMGSSIEFSSIGDFSVFIAWNEHKGVRVKHCEIGAFNIFDIDSLTNAKLGDRVDLDATEIEVCRIGSFSNVDIEDSFVHGLRVGERSIVTLEECHGPVIVGDDAIVRASIMPRAKEQGVFSVPDGKRLVGTIEPGDELD